MGNVGSSSNGRRRQGSRRNQHPPAPQPELPANQYVFAAATPYPSQYPNSNPNPNALPHPYYQYPSYYPQPPLPAPFDHHHRPPHVDPTHGNWVGGPYPYGPLVPPVAPYVEHQKAVTIRNDVNLKKETLKVVPDEENPGRFLVTFTFDATVAGSLKHPTDIGLPPIQNKGFL